MWSFGRLNMKRVKLTRLALELRRPSETLVVHVAVLAARLQVVQNVPLLREYSFISRTPMYGTGTLQVKSCTNLSTDCVHRVARRAEHVDFTTCDGLVSVVILERKPEVRRWISSRLTKVSVNVTSPGTSHDISCLKRRQLILTRSSTFAGQNILL